MREETATVGGKGRITIPKGVREKVGINSGDELLFRVTATGAVEMVPMALVPRDQVWFYTKAMQERVAGAEDDIRLGRTTATSTVEEIDEHLDSLDEEGE